MDNPALLILVVEDDFLIQELVGSALTEGGFQTEITASGEEAVNLLQGDATKYRALLTDIHLSGKLAGWGRRQACQRDQSGNTRGLHDGGWCRSMAVSRRSE